MRPVMRMACIIFKATHTPIATQPSAVGESIMLHESARFMPMTMSVPPASVCITSVLSVRLSGATDIYGGSPVAILRGSLYAVTRTISASTLACNIHGMTIVGKMPVRCVVASSVPAQLRATSFFVTAKVTIRMTALRGSRIVSARYDGRIWGLPR